MRKRLIYICSPLRGDIEKNIQKAQGYCREAVDLWPDVIPIAPHVYCTQFLDDTIPQEREAGMELGIALLDMCDELWVYGINNPSEGMKKEIAYAKEHGIPVKDAADLYRLREQEKNRQEDKELGDALHNDLNEPDDIPETPEAEAVISQKGDLWILGRHRVVCGDATNEQDRELLLDGAHPEILLTDPPYCSGGFQESGRITGSIGSKQSDGKGGFTTPTISSDNLSTRGYQVLMKNVLGATDIKVAYIFTDWRMWIYLFDLVEGSGLGVRNMIVWNKQSPGMGNGWRAQHELIMFAHRTKPKWDNHKGYGNVLEATHSGNELHPTQKPVEILEKLLDNTQWAEGVLDTFGGSGTTLIAAESVGQQAFLMEMEPAFVDTIVRRYIRTTGKTTGIRLIRKGSEQPREVFEGIFE